METEYFKDDELNLLPNTNSKCLMPYESTQDIITSWLAKNSPTTLNFHK